MYEGIPVPGGDYVRICNTTIGWCTMSYVSRSYDEVGSLIIAMRGNPSNKLNKVYY